MPLKPFIPTPLPLKDAPHPSTSRFLQSAHLGSRAVKVNWRNYSWAEDYGTTERRIERPNGRTTGELNITLAAFMTSGEAGFRCTGSASPVRVLQPNSQNQYGLFVMDTVYVIWVAGLGLLEVVQAWVCKHGARQTCGIVHGIFVVTIWVSALRR